MNTLQKRAAQRGQGGFTLIELLVVIAILAILAGVVVFAVGNSTDSAKKSACKAEAKTFSTAANAAKAARLDPDTAAASIFSFLDATGSSGAYKGEYFSLLESGNTVTFGALPANTFGADCPPPKTVNY